MGIFLQGSYLSFPKVTVGAERKLGPEAKTFAGAKLHNGHNFLLREEGKKGTEVTQLWVSPGRLRTVIQINQKHLWGVPA